MAVCVGFGDLLVRLSPPGYERFLQAQSFQIQYTGAEANALVALALQGVETEFVTRVPKHAIADAALNELRRYGVGVGRVVRGGRRMGVFYAETGASQRPSRVIYDREHTALAEAVPEDFDWETILRGADHLHLTGITPALGQRLPEICLDACRTARRLGATVSCDLNYRSALWSPEQAFAALDPMMEYVDLLIANEEDAVRMLHVTPIGREDPEALPDDGACLAMAGELTERYGLSAVAFTMRRSISASDHFWTAALCTGGAVYRGPQYTIHLVDRIGGGDAFAAGLLRGYLLGDAPQRMVDYAVASSCLKQTMERDFNLCEPWEVEQLLAGSNGGRIQR